MSDVTGEDYFPLTSHLIPLIKEVFCFGMASSFDRLPSYSVLMCVYDKEIPVNFNDSLESMLMQTYPPDDFVLVCDGKLTNELNIIAKSFASEYKSIFRIIRTEENMTQGAALNIGIAACKQEIIVKMDSDDISEPDRCETQMRVFALDPELDMLGGWVEEFDSETGKAIALKKCPLHHREIMQYAKRRNPFNRQTVAFRKSKAFAAGGYSDLAQCSDYEFAVRMLQSGAKGQNLPKMLVRYRVSKSYRRKKHWNNTKSFIIVRHRIYKSGFSSLMDFLIPVTAQLMMFILPTRFTDFLYKKFLRR